MNAPVPVYAAARARGQAATVLASLPRSYAPAETAGGSVTVIDGSPGWPTAATDALDTGAVGVIVVHPEPADVTALRASTGLIALDTRWAANPAVDSARAAFIAALPHGSRLESQVHQPVGTRLEIALLDQLVLVRSLVGPVTDVRILTWSSHGYAAEGVVDGHAVDLSLVCTEAVPPSAWARLLTDDGGVEVTIPSGVTAEPARLMVTGPDGARLSPTLYESGHRATWRRVRDLLSVHSTATDLDDFASDSEMARTAFQLAEG